ncbi:FkbM family methyltransferase [Novosphingobium aquae]|uniref:FkbM family methyltransferase n=1 Tax=Novosphingobium aquae TaxID=3133435 RepID=A0ABU8SDV8_9SPHN
MKRSSSFTKNAISIATRPDIWRDYAAWLLAALRGKPAELEILDCMISGFPNFSSYLGARRHAPTNDEIELVRECLSGARVIFDVGANFGAFAIPFSTLVPQARIFAFEPNPQTAHALRRNLLMNDAGNVTVIEAIISDRNGMLGFSNSRDPATNRIIDDPSAGCAVRSITIAEFCRDNEIGQIDFLKIDVEGAEILVLEGARPLFEKGNVRGGMIEVCPGNLRNFGNLVQDLKDFFDSNGYSLEVIGGNHGEPPSEGVRLANAIFRSSSEPL